jgi:hypothetical protein
MIMDTELHPFHTQRDLLRAQYQNAYDRLATLLFQHDPIGIGFEDCPDEYEPEVATILPRLRGCSTETECLQVIHEEFCQWFGEETAGSPADYETIAHEVWIMWNEESLN